MGPQRASGRHIYEGQGLEGFGQGSLSGVSGSRDRIGSGVKSFGGGGSRASDPVESTNQE